MAKVIGIGGVFFKAEDTQAARDWYARVLGFDVQDWGGAMFPHPAVGYQVWSIHDAGTPYYDPSPSRFMINYMVDDLDGVLEKANSEGAEALGREDGEFGRFAWLMDPVGVKIELWEPPATPPAT
jgi:predicted enzyme related to lactoylglutathione lyase